MSWMYILGVYVGIAILFSVFVPMRRGRSVDTLQDVSPIAKVVGGFLWPLIVIAWAAFSLATMFR